MKVSEAVSNLERRRFRRMGGQTPWLESYCGQVVIPKFTGEIDLVSIIVGADGRVGYVMTTADLIADDWELEEALPLEPCPFCHCSHLEVQKSKNSGKVKWVYCFSCNAEGPAMKTEMEAVEKWNSVSKMAAAAATGTGTTGKCGGACTCR